MSEHRPKSHFKALPQELQERVKAAPPKEPTQCGPFPVCWECWPRLPELLERPICAPSVPPQHASPPGPTVCHYSSGSDTDFDPCMLCGGQGLILVRDGDHAAVGAHFLAKFALKAPLSDPPYYLCERCQKDCVTLRRASENVCERRAAGGKRKRGRKPKRPRTEAEMAYGLDLPQSSTSNTSPLDRRRTSTFTLHSITPVPFTLDESMVSSALATPFDGDQTDGEAEHVVLDDTTAKLHGACYPVDVRVLLADLQALHEVSGHNAGPVYARCTGAERVPSRWTAHRCLVEKALCCIEQFALDLPHLPRNLVLGTDTTTTYDHRHLIEVHLGTDHSRELVKFDDIDGGPHSLVRTCFAPAL